MGIDVKAAIGLVAVTLAVTSCNSPEHNSSGTDQHHDSNATVVASTDVWGSVAEHKVLTLQIVGDAMARPAA